MQTKQIGANSMERWWFNSMFFNKFKNKLERGCGLNKSMESLGPIENNSESEDPNLKDRVKNIHRKVSCQF